MKYVLDKIIAFREFKHISQEYMAEKLGMSQSSYSDLEHGRKKLDMELIGRIAEILEVKESYYFGSGPMVVQIHDNQHNNNVGYNQIEHQHMVPKELLDRVLSAHERLIDVFEKAFGRGKDMKPD